MTKRKLGKAIVQYGLFLFFLYVLLTFLFQPWLLFGRYQYYAIPTNSMEPTIQVGDLIVADHKIAIEEIAIGDIFLFETEIQSQRVVVVHYLHDIEVVDGERRFISIAENTDVPDDFVIGDEDIVGTYMFRIPYLGTLLRFVAHPIGKAVVIIDIMILYYLYHLFVKKKDLEEKI